jgi:hypothetical protein
LNNTNWGAPLVATPHLLQHGLEQIATPWRAEQGLAAITTAGDEM